MRMESKILLSVAIITKNEEKRIGGCLESVAFADDIIIVDSGSTDRTLEIARTAGCRVFVEDWKGYGPQKNSAVAKCVHDWVLILDADERIAQAGREEIARIVGAADSADAYKLPRKNFFHGKWIKHCDWWPDEIIRLVRKSKGGYHQIIHERWVTEGTVSKSEACIEHFSFSNYHDMLRVLNDRSTDMARELWDRGKRANVSTPFLHGIAMFIKTYVLKLGFLEGLDGFVIATTKAGGTYFKYAKLLELQNEAMWCEKG